MTENSRTQTKLKDITMALSRPTSNVEAVNLTAAGITELLRADMCVVYLQSEENKETLQVYRHANTGTAEFEFIGVGEGPVAACLQSGETIQQQSGREENVHRSNGNKTDRSTAETSLYVPLTARDRTIGVVEVRSAFLANDGQDKRNIVELLAPLLASVVISGQKIHQQTVLNADLEARCWEIRRERSILANVFDNLPFPFYCIDRDYRLVAINTFTALRGNSEAYRLLGLRCYEALYHRSEPCPGCRIGESLTAGIMTFRQGRNWEQDGDPREWEISTYPLRDDHGQVVEAVVLEQDATEKNRLIESLARTAKLAAVEQLAAGVAHEINNPLVAIIANSQLLQRELEPDDSKLESIDLIAQAGDRALGVVQALLDLAQQDSYNFKPTDINESIRSAVHLIKHRLASEEIDLDLFLSPELPLLQASPNHLQAMWLNLLFNARDALNQMQGRIRITSVQQGNYVVVTVQDDGIGISEEKLSRIFEPFYTTKDPGEGPGLGLSVCHRIVRQLGGKIQVRSETGQGTEFIVSLPIIT
ncbi:MAG: PAS domain-containing protein [Anaerolineales bacterium]|nr:PAS domain-containing protein [Anaerolineales bacterium]